MSNYKAIFLFGLMVVFLDKAVAQGNDLDELQGSWVSEQHSYGFRIEGSRGYATHWTNTYNPGDETGPGDLVLKDLEYTRGFVTASQLFYDGRWVSIRGTLEDGKLHLSGSRSEWVMVRPR